jgi:hypothetical protein
MASSPISEQPHGVPAEYFTDSYVFNWRNQTFRADLIFILPIAVCLGTGLWLRHPAAGMIAASGAMTVGFGAKQSIDESRLLPRCDGRTVGIWIRNAHDEGGWI